MCWTFFRGLTQRLTTAVGTRSPAASLRTVARVQRHEEDFSLLHEGNLTLSPLLPLICCRYNVKSLVCHCIIVYFSSILLTQT